MTLSATRYFSKGRVGLGGSTASVFNKFDQTTTPQYNVGFEVREADGSAYRYASFGATANRGVLCSANVSETTRVDTDNAIIAPASSVTTTDSTVGSKFIEMTLASVTAGQYAGGKFITTDDSGEGYTYDVVGNTATGTPASGNIRVELLQPLQVALDATTDFTIASNIWNDLKIATTTDAVACGVSCVTVTAAGNYAWVQTKGICGVLQDAVVPVVGAAVELSTTVAGCVSASQTAGVVGTLLLRPIVGYCVDPGDSTGHTAVRLLLD